MSEEKKDFCRHAKCLVVLLGAAVVDEDSPLVTHYVIGCVCLVFFAILMIVIVNNNNSYNNNISSS